MQTIFQKIETDLLVQGYRFERKDFNRPWGGFWVIEGSQSQAFIRQYFKDVVPEQFEDGVKISPKILLVAPNRRLSWQYHHRRSEIWQVVEGEVGIVRSLTDEEGAMEVFKAGDQIQLAQGERHRLVGLEDWGIVAEIWVHTKVEHPSDEEDIVRLQDDFSRG